MFRNMKSSQGSVEAVRLEVTEKYREECSLGQWEYNPALDSTPSAPTKGGIGGTSKYSEHPPG